MAEWISNPNKNDKRSADSWVSRPFFCDKMQRNFTFDIFVCHNFTKMKKSSKIIDKFIAGVYNIIR